MRIALRIFLSYLFLSLLLGGATLVAAYWSIDQLVSGIVTEGAIEMGRELGLFFTSTGGHSFDELTPEQRDLLQQQIQAYARQSERVPMLVIVDNDCRIRFASDPKILGETFREEADRRILRSKETTVRKVPFGPNASLREITVPLRSLLGGRIGALRVRLNPTYYRDFLDKPRRDMLRIFAAMVLFITATGVALGSLLTIPVRRLNRTLLELQQGGPAQVEVDPRSDFAPTLRVVRGLGERLEALAASSRSSEILLSSITQSLEQGVVVVDASGRVVTINDSALRMLDCGSGAEGTEAASRLLSSDPGFSRLLSDASAGDARSVDLLPRAGTGGKRGVRVSSYVLREQGKVSGMMLLLRDLDSIRTLEQHLQEAGRLSLLVRLTSTVAHEIKNPLNSMVINVEALRSVLVSIPSNAKAECERYLEVIVREIYHLDDVIREYLGLAASGEREGATTDVREALDNIVELIRFEANKSRVHLQCEISPQLPAVPVAAVRLKQALLNLCLNAIQAMENGGTLTVRARVESGAVCIEVSDTGPGISSEIQPNIFDFHFTTKKRGSGLGLPIARMIVETGGGAIDFDSQPGQGTTFRLWFPSAQPAATASAG